MKNVVEMNRINSCILYILLNVCKKDKNSSKYIPMQFTHFKWIVDRANFISAIRYGIEIIPNKYLSICEELELVPKTFKKKIISEDKRVLLFDNISISDLQCMNNVILKYKIYGKITQSLKDIF